MFRADGPAWREPPVRLDAAYPRRVTLTWPAVADVLGDIWRRAVTVQPPPSLRTTLLIGIAALVLVSIRLTWRPVRMVATMAHEAGHALTALVSGRRLAGIRLHADTSGLTLSKGRPRGPGMVLTLMGGYPAPTVLGLGAAVLLGLGYSAGVLWLLVAACVVMLALIRNAYGLLVVLVAGGILAAVSWLAPAVVLSGVAVIVVWLLLLSAPRPLVELARSGRAGRGSDVDQLARITVLPGWAWLAFFWLFTVAGLAAGSYLMLWRAVGS